MRDKLKSFGGSILKAFANPAVSNAWAIGLGAGSAAWASIGGKRERLYRLTDIAFTIAAGDIAGSPL